MAAKKPVTKKVTKSAPRKRSTLPKSDPVSAMPQPMAGHTAPVERWAIVLEVTHKVLFFKHKHYIVEVVDGDRTKAKHFADAATQAAEISQSLMPQFQVKLLCMERVEVIHHV